VDQEASAVDRARSSTDLSESEQILESSQCSEGRDDDDESPCEHRSWNLTFINDRSFKSDPDDSSAENEPRKCDEPRVIRKDAEIQTSSRTSRTSWWRRRTRERGSRTTSEETFRRACDDEPAPRATYEKETFSAGLRSRSDGKDHVEKSRLTVRVLENKRAEYIDKFNAVNRQIEEITATLRETCCSGRNPRGNNPDEYEYLAADNAKVKAKRRFDESEAAVLPKADDGEDPDSISAESEGEQETSRVERVDDEASSVMVLGENTEKNSRLAAVLPMDRYGDSDLFLRDFGGALATNETARSERRVTKRRQVAKEISVDLDDSGRKEERDEREESSIEDESSSEIYAKDDFGLSNSDEYARAMPIDDLVGALEGLRSKKIAEEKMGERAMLVDIKRRIDRDFDNLPAEKREGNDSAEDFLVIPRQKSNSLETAKCRFYDTTTPRGIIEESRSTPLLTYGQSTSDTSDVRIRDSTSVGTVSDYSNRNSTLSKYFSCTQLSSLISLSENEDELERYALNDQDTIARDLSCANLRSDSNYYDLDLGSSADYLNRDSNPNDSTYSNRDSSFNRSSFNAGYAIRYYDSSAPYKSPGEFLIEPFKRRNDMFERSEDGDLENKVYGYEYLSRDNGKAKESGIELEKRYTTDSTFDSTSKSSRYIGSIDSGVFVNSSLIDFYPHESSVDAGKSGVKRKIPCTRSLNESSLDSSSDGSCTDDTLGQKVDDVVRDLTKNLILCERRARMRLEEMHKSFRAKEAPYVRIRDPVVFAKFLWHLEPPVADRPKRQNRPIIN